MEKERLGSAKPAPACGTPDCPMLRLARQQTGRSREKKKALRLKITGLSSGAPDCPVSQQRSRPTIGCTISGRRVAHANGRLGTPDCLVCTGQCQVHQPDPRPNGRLRPIRKEIEHQTGTVAVRCTTRQKARFAFQVDLQRLLAALGL
jgi:hypothetical protein